MSADKISDDDVELVARTLCNLWRPPGQDWWPAADELTRGSWRAQASAILAALAGRLLPAGPKHEFTEWGVKSARFGIDGPISAADGNHEGMARRLHRLHPDSLALVCRTVTKWLPDGPELVGPWVNVEEGS